MNGNSPYICIIAHLFGEFNLHLLCTFCFFLAGIYVSCRYRQTDQSDIRQFLDDVGPAVREPVPGSWLYVDIDRVELIWTYRKYKKCKIITNILPHSI